MAVIGKDSGTLQAATELSIVFVHGFTQSARTWEPLYTAFEARGISVSSFELAGHGSAICPVEATSYHIDIQADALLSFMHKAGGGKPVVVVGYSMGGRIALVAAQRKPLAFAALVLESAGIGPANQGERMQLAKRNRAWAQRIRSEGVGAFMEWWASLPLFETQRMLSQDVRDALQHERNANDAQALAYSLEEAGAHMMPSSVDVLALLHSLASANTPVVYIAGAYDARYGAIAHCVKEKLAELPSAHIVIIDKAGHNVHLEQPEAFVSVISSVLDDVIAHVRL